MRKLLLSSFILLPSSFVFSSPPSSDYRLLFADEFNGPTLDTSKWSAASPGWTMPNSASTASASMVSVSGGLLTLSAARNGTTSSFTSGSISSYQKFNYAGGYTEARILLPNTVGSWPAFWGLYTGWPPEVDIMEYPLTTNGGTSGLQNNQYNTAFHYTNSTGGNSSGAGVVTRPSDLRGSYHTFGMDWVTNTSVAFYFDGAQVASFTNSAVSQMANMYMILDYAVGGWPGTPSLTQWPAGLTDQMKVDYVRVYQKDPGDPTASWNVNGGGSWDTATNWSGAGGLPPRFGDQIAYFGRVGSAPSAVVSIGSWHVVGGITFDGSASGTTVYVIGSPTSTLQLASTTGTSTVQATAASTASQAINSRLELWSNTTVRNDMTGGQTINLNGDISGAGSLSVDGPGTVILAGNNSYTGGTTIDAGAAGPAVLRVNASEALGTGTVTIGPVGNSTTARLELYGTRTLSNPIDLRGRNTATVAVQSTRGDNTLAGTVTLGVGGSNYWLQSDPACTLTLSNPTSLTSAASGARNVTLQGAGAGRITGAITNGSATLAITKDGAGTWTLSGPNSYTGTTTVTAGTLVLRSAAWSPVLTSPAGGDLQTQGRLVFDYTGTTSPASSINTALGNGTLRSSTADANHTLGYLDDQATTVTVLPALYGDANLDGTLNADDYALIDKGFSSHGTYWWQGDFNHDGAVTTADYLLIDRTYLQQQGGGPSPTFLAQRESQFGANYVSQLLPTVPEPASFLAACGLALLPLSRQNRRR